MPTKARATTTAPPPRAKKMPITPPTKPTSLLDNLWKKLKKLKKAKPKIGLNPKHPISKRISKHNTDLKAQMDAISGGKKQ